MPIGEGLQLGFKSKRAPQKTAAGVLLRILLLAAICSATADPDNERVEAKVAAWLLEQGAELNGVTVGRACPTCMRGVLATKSFQNGDIIMRIPFSVMIVFGEGYSYFAELARELLLRMHNDPAFNATWGLYWQTHPGPEDMFTPELYSDEHLEMLQTPELEALTRRHRDLCEQVFNGSYGGGLYEPLPDAAPAATLDAFRHVTAVVHSRSFSLARGTNRRGVGHMIPLLDLINHDDDAPNCRWYLEGEQGLVLNAHLPINEGQELTFNYLTNVAHRPDMSLFYFGFVEPREPPLLAAVDLPGLDPNQPYAQTAPDDSMYGDPAGRYVTREEYERLKGRLEATGSTLEQDEALLGSTTEWRRRMLLQYRIQRKRALQLTMDKIAAHLELHDGEAPEVASDRGGIVDDDREL